MSGVTGQAQGRLPCSAAKSAPENAAMTPGALRAADTSTRVIRACAIGLRTNATCTMPGSWMLSVQLVCPVTSRASSLRARGLPISVVTVMTPLLGRPTLCALGGRPPQAPPPRA